MKIRYLPSIPQFDRSSLILAFKIATILVASLAFFYQDLNIIFNDALQDESTSHILVIPLLFAYLVYRKRKMLRAVVPLENQNQPKETKYLPTIIGTLLFITAILLYWYGSYTFTPLEYHLFALPILVAGLALILFNYQTLFQLAFPIAFLLFLMPPPSEILYGFGATLSVISSEASNTIVNALGIPSTITSEFGNPTIVITRPDNTTTGFTVDIACSGIYSLIGFLVFAAFIAYITRDKTWKKTSIFLIGLPLIYLLNIIRITIILLIGYQYGEQLALQIFHLLGGWILTFIGTIALMTITEKVFKTRIFTRKQQQNSCRNCNPNTSNVPETFCSHCGRLLKYSRIILRKDDIVKMAAIAATILILISIQAPVFALTKGPAPILIQTPTGEQGNTQILPQVRDYTLEFMYRDTIFEQKAKQNASLVYIYEPQNLTRESVYVGVEIAQTRSSLHRWETCLITFPQTHGYQPKVAQLDLRDVQIMQNPPIIARYFAFQYMKYNQTQVVLYWYETSTFTINNISEQKHVKISLIVYPDAPEGVTKTEDQLLTFAKAIANHWQPIKSWSQIALILSKNGSAFIVFSLAILALTISVYIVENRMEKRRNANAYNKLAEEEQRIVEAVEDSKRGTIPTLNNIALTYKENNEETIEPETLLQKLEKTKEIWLIQKEVTNVQDEPTQTWRTNLVNPCNKNPKKIINIFSGFKRSFET